MSLYYISINFNIHTIVFHIMDKYTLSVFLMVISYYVYLSMLYYIYLGKLDNIAVAMWVHPEPITHTYILIP